MTTKKNIIHDLFLLLRLQTSVNIRIRRQNNHENKTETRPYKGKITIGFTRKVFEIS